MPRGLPNVQRAWRQALERLHEEPTRIGAREGYGVIIDDVAAVRVMRGTREPTAARTRTFDACGRWNVGQAETDLHAPVVSDVPVLILHPHFDPFSPLPLINETASTLSNSVVVDLQLGYNVTWHDCPIAIRNAFIKDATSPPDTSSVEDMPEIDLSPTQEGL